MATKSPDASSATSPLSPEQEQQWREKGYAIVPNLLESDIVKGTTEKMAEIFKDDLGRDFGSFGRCEFPTNSIIDKIILHPNIIEAVSQLLRTPHVVLTQSEGWSKAGHEYEGSQENKDQRFHMDYGNNTWLHPTPWHEPENVAMIVYLADTEETEGGTAVCPREGDDDELYQPPYINMPGQAGHWEFYNDRAHAEAYFERVDPEVAAFRRKLYEREVIPTYKPGDVLFYRYDIWHRGTPVKVGQRRSVINLAFTKRECFWHLTWNRAWTQGNYYGDNERTLIGLSPRQRAVIGIPEPGHPYWNATKIRNFAARYPGIDVTPYMEMLKEQ